MKTSHQFIQIIHSLLCKFQQIHFQRKRPCCIQKMHSNEFHYFGANVDYIAFGKVCTKILYKPLTWHLTGDSKLQVLQDFALK